MTEAERKSIVMLERFKSARAYALMFTLYARTHVEISRCAELRHRIETCLAGVVWA